jgi:hypothetical protein
MMERTLPLCQALQPDADRFALSAEPVQYLDSHGRRRFWGVEYTDQAGKYVAKFTWNADTGQLLRVSHWLPEDANRPSAATADTGPGNGEQAKARAARLSYRWLCRLGMDEGRSRWHLSRAPERSPVCDAWTVTWGSGARAVLVKVNAVSGDLIYAQSIRLSASAEGEE